MSIALGTLLGICASILLLSVFVEFGPIIAFFAGPSGGIIGGIIAWQLATRLGKKAKISYNKVALTGATTFILVFFIMLFIGYPFNPGGSNIGGTICPSSSPFVCLGPGSAGAPVLTTMGNLQFTFGQSSGYTYYNAELSCLSTSNSLSSDPSAGATLYTPLINTTLISGQTIQISNLTCYGQSGPIGKQPKGTPFTVVIWLNYSTSPGVVASARVATVTLKVT